MSELATRPGDPPGRPGEEDAPPPATAALDRVAALMPLIEAIAARVVRKLHGDELGAAPLNWRLAASSLVLAAPAVLDWAL